MLCRCDCGVEKEIRANHLHRGATTSCGCRMAAKKCTTQPVATTDAFDVFGERMSLGEIASIAGKRPDQIWHRLRSGWTPEEAAFGKTQAAALAGIAERSKQLSSRPACPTPDPVERSIYERVAALEAEVAALRSTQGRA